MSAAVGREVVLYAVAIGVVEPDAFGVLGDGVVDAVPPQPVAVFSDEEGLAPGLYAVVLSRPQPAA